jgi:hypothetical protein
MSVEQLLPNPADWDKILSSISKDALAIFFIEGIEGAKQELYQLLIAEGILPEGEVITIAGSFDVHNPRVEQWLKDYSFKFAQKVNQTTADNLRTTLTEGLNAGEGIADLKKRVKEVFGPETRSYRAEMIARTEAHRANLHGRQELWKEANRDMILAGEQSIYVGRVWRASADACEYCVALDGKQVGIDEPFFRQGDVYELDGVGRMKLDYEDISVSQLHPNCRCSCLPVINPTFLSR